MKNSFYSIWAKVVVCCFWMMIFSFLIVGLTIHLMNQLNVWNLLPLPLTGLHFIFVLAIITTILGVFISMFIFKHALNPITQLSRSMQQVAEGNYNVKLDADPHKGEIHDLLTNFNHMVQELNSTETLHSDFISSVSHEFKTLSPPSVDMPPFCRTILSLLKNEMNISISSSGQQENCLI